MVSGKNGHTKGRSDREVVPTPHGECRKPVIAQPTYTGISRRYDIVSILVFMSVFNMILSNIRSVFSCVDAND